MEGSKKGSEDLALKVLIVFIGMGFVIALILAISFFLILSPFLLIFLFYFCFKKIKTKIYGKIIGFKVKKEIIYPISYMNQGIDLNINNSLNFFYFEIKKYYLRVKDPTGWYSVRVSEELFQALKETKYKVIELEIEKSFLDDEYVIC